MNKLSKHPRLFHAYHIIQKIRGDQSYELWDVGCDHGLLGIEVLKDGQDCLFCDPSQGTKDVLETKIRQINKISKNTKLGAHRIIYDKGENLPWKEFFRPSLKIKILAILGMGTRTIESILSKALTERSEGQSCLFIFCPHTELERFETFLGNCQFTSCEKEEITERGRKRILYWGSF